MRPHAVTVDLLVRDAAWVVTQAGDDLRGGWVACTDGVVVGTGSAGTEPPAAAMLDATGCVVTPGLVNAHHHLFQNLTRAHAPSSNVPLGPWLAALRPVWAQLDPGTAHLSAWVGLADLALNGCTTTADNIYLHPTNGLVEATHRAAEDIGLRLDPTRGYIDRAVLDVPGAEDADTVLRESRTLMERLHDPAPSSHCRVSFGPTSLSATTTPLLSELAKLAAQGSARLHTHLFEEADETIRSMQIHDRGPVDLLVASGWSDHAWIAHGCYIGPLEARDLARAGIGVAHCPSSNLLLGGRSASQRVLRDAGCTVGLGTDGAASAGTSQLWLEARTALLLARQEGGPAALSARQSLAIATLGSAECLGRSGEIGTLAVGMQADLAVWDTRGPAYAGAVTDPVESLLRCGPPRARHTVVAGRPVVRDGALVAPGLDSALAEHERMATAWQSHTPIAKGHYVAGRS